MLHGPIQRSPHIAKPASRPASFRRHLRRVGVIAAAIIIVLLNTGFGGPEASSAAAISISDYGAFEVQPANPARRRGPLGRLENDFVRTLKETLAGTSLKGSTPAIASKKVAILKSGLISCGWPDQAPSAKSPDVSRMCVAKTALTDKENGRFLTEFVVGVPIANSRREIARDTLRRLARAVLRRAGDMVADMQRRQRSTEVFRTRRNEIHHRGGGHFEIVVPAGENKNPSNPRNVHLKRIGHAYDPKLDPDVAHLTDVTLNDRVPPMIDGDGRHYAMLTLYNVDPPLDGLPSREPGIDRGIDFRDPANLIKGTYSNYVSPVSTADEERRPVPGHPIGHFYVKLQIPGYPTILTGMTTIKRADEELVDLTIGRELGIGGVLLTPQPGRLNSAAEALEELTLRQRKLLVIDGVRYRRSAGGNVGPTYTITDGNVTFARFKLPPQNAKDALAFFLEYVDRRIHNTFGSLVNRPHKGTGAGCSAFAMAWLKASGVIPVVEESAIERTLDDVKRSGNRDLPFWARYYRRISIPWAHLGCDDRIGLGKPAPARYTIYDLLFYRETDETIIEASAGLAEKIRKEVGPVGATLFRFGAFTPLRSLFINAKRNDPADRGDYRWASAGQGLPIAFWDNRLFSLWVKGIRAKNDDPGRYRAVREGRFLGVEIDAMDVPRQANDFFAMADRIVRSRKKLIQGGVVPKTCRSAIALGLQ